MTSWRTLVGNSETLTAADLDAAGGHVTGMIQSVSGARFEEDGETDAPKKIDKKALVAFTGKEKKFAANTINCLLMEQMWGEDYEAWTGHRLTIMSDKVEVKGKFFGNPCIRVKGSPELDKALTVKIQLPKRRAFNRQLVPTTGGTKDPAPATQGDAGASSPPSWATPPTTPDDGTDEDIPF